MILSGFTLTPAASLFLYLEFSVGALILVDALNDESLDRLEMTILIHSRRTLVAALDKGGIHRLDPGRSRRHPSGAIVVIEIGVGEAVWLITCRAATNVSAACN